jgi:hypothetical protein
MASTAADNPMNDNETTYIVIGFVVVIIIIAILCSCSPLCPAYGQVGKRVGIEKVHSPYRK